MLTDTKDRFGWVSIVLHWSNAILVLALLYFGVQIAIEYYYSIQIGFWDGAFVLDETSRRPFTNRWPMIQFAVDWHVAIGIIAIPILLARVVWRIRNSKPVTHHQPPLPHFAAETAWRILLIGIVWQVVTGPIWLWWRGSSLDFFHYFEIPTPWPFEPGPVDRFVRHESTFNLFLEYSHLFVGLLMGAVFLLHALGALKHHFVDKDVVLKRMLSASNRVSSDVEQSRRPSSGHAVGAKSVEERSSAT